MTECPEPTRRARLPPRILVVDDDEAILRIFERVLRRWGYLTCSASTARGALQLLDSFRPHLVLVDLHLPDMRGAALVDRVRKTSADHAPRILAMTGDAIDAVEGAEMVLCKPFDMRALAEVVAAHTRRAA